MHASPANTAIKSIAQGGHGVDVSTNDEGLDHRAGLTVRASVGYAIGNNHNRRTI
jgi:hypothetical protein